MSHSYLHHFIEIVDLLCELSIDFKVFSWHFLFVLLSGGGVFCTPFRRSIIYFCVLYRFLTPT
jgi:hypothetical protein